jgi:hypothetical protein
MCSCCNSVYSGTLVAAGVKGSETLEYQIWLFFTLLYFILLCNIITIMIVNICDSSLPKT